MELDPASDGARSFTARFFVPSRLSRADYRVEAFAVSTAGHRAPERPGAGHPGGRARVPGDLAFNHGAWYGVLASVIALLGGLAIGLVFQSKGAH